MIWCSIKYRSLLWFYVALLAYGSIAFNGKVGVLACFFIATAALRGTRDKFDPVRSYGLLPIKRKAAATLLWMEFLAALPAALVSGQYFGWLLLDAGSWVKTPGILRFAAMDVLIMSAVAGFILFWCLPAPLSWRKRGWGQLCSIATKMLGVGSAAVMGGGMYFVWQHGISPVIMIVAITLIALSFYRREDLLDALQKQKQTTEIQFSLGAITQATGFNIYRRITSIALQNMLMLIIPFGVILWSDLRGGKILVLFFPLVIIFFAGRFVKTLGTPREARCLPYSTERLAFYYLAFPTGSVAIGFFMTALLFHALPIESIPPLHWLALTAPALMIISIYTYHALILHPTLGSLLTLIATGFLMFFMYAPIVSDAPILLSGILIIPAPFVMLACYKLLRDGLNEDSDPYKKGATELA